MITAENLRRAADLTEQISKLTQERDALLNGGIVASNGKRVFTPEAIEKIRAGQRKRWRNARKAKEALVPQVVESTTPLVI